MKSAIVVTAVLVWVLHVSLGVSGARLAGECAMICNDLRFEVLTLDMCREAKRTLPKPKVGDFCSTAMEQGFSDACVALCMDNPPQARVAQTCRAAAVEMPRPTVRRWCEHGYTVAFQKTVKDLKYHFKAEPELDQSAPAEPVDTQASRALNEGDSDSSDSDVGRVPAAHSNPGATLQGQHASSASATASSATGEGRTVLATIPVTLDDVTHDLLVYEGTNAEDSVVEFCRVHVPDDVTSCIRQLLPVVLEKLE